MGVRDSLELSVTESGSRGCGSRRNCAVPVVGQARHDVCQQDSNATCFQTECPDECHVAEVGSITVKASRCWCGAIPCKNCQMVSAWTVTAIGLQRQSCFAGPQVEVQPGTVCTRGNCYSVTQATIALSSAESEFYATGSATARGLQCKVYLSETERPCELDVSQRQHSWARLVPTDRRRQSTPSGVAILVDSETAEVESVSFEQRDDRRDDSGHSHEVLRVAKD